MDNSFGRNRENVLDSEVCKYKYMYKHFESGGTGLWGDSNFILLIVPR